jgi:hypothetical protein
MILHPNLFQTPNTGNQSAQRTPIDHTTTQHPTHKKYYNCGQKGHFTNSCPNPRSHPPLTLEATSALPPTRNGSSTLTQGQQNHARGRVNQVSMEEVQNATNMLPGTSLVIPFCLNRLLHSFLFCSWESRDEIPVKWGSLVTHQNSKFWNVTKIH